MPGQLILAVAVVLAAVVLAGVAWLANRRRFIGRNGGIVACGLRLGPGQSWRRGVAEYQPDRLCWYPAVGARLKPAACFDRAGLRIIGSRPPAAAETARLGPGIVIAECDDAGSGSAGCGSARHPELALSEAAFTGLLAWLESSPEFYLRAG